MNYLIENHIVFNPEDNSLSLPGDSENQIAVSNPARRILLLLIEQQGIVVEREIFFKKVWEDYGLTASNNNLNHCISKLRKAMVTLGYPDEFIVTVPKVGFTIRKEIIIEPYFTHDLSPEPVHNREFKTAPEVGLTEAIPEGETSVPAALPLTVKEESDKPKKKLRHDLMISLLVTTALTLSAFLILYYEVRDPKTELKVSKIGVCDLYSTVPVIVSRKLEFIQLAESFLHKNNIKCKPGNIFIFQSERFTSPVNTGSVRDFMAQCITDDNHKANICISYYTNDRTTHDQ
ncbi:winged helix-turn-helix domain-containing protein [Rahnella sp. L72c]|uniref:Winged helix-turn-helix domain-containing protein n=1 Tax=Rahnella perminowiae TaxID=2816244 RepID=A0ABS6L0B8_9GAMM|nr:winged helix-turn-helix domain-containing protein [Rahnella perminowiae]MBU9835291.1 winged helix-turn-helix domain-containing protein [Rahnella perminowiae]